MDVCVCVCVCVCNGKKWIKGEEGRGREEREKDPLHAVVNTSELKIQ